MTDGEVERFRELCAEVSKRGRGLSLPELSAARALAEEEQQGRPDSDRAQVARGTLGVQ